jgi:hypothetical protein
MVLIWWRKVIQFQFRTFWLPLPRLKSNSLCPVQAIFNCFQFTQGAILDNPAFVYKVNGLLLPLTCDMFITRVRRCLTLSSVNPSEIVSHSFRRGGATFCYAVGLPAESIKLLCDWRSSCYQSYLDNDTSSSLAIIRHMQQALLRPSLFTSVSPSFSYVLLSIGIHTIIKCSHVHVTI